MWTGKLESVGVTDPGLVHGGENRTADHVGIVMKSEEEEKKQCILSNVI